MPNDSHRGSIERVHLAKDPAAPARPLGSPAPSHIIGPDVSHHQGHIALATWKACLGDSRVRFAKCKASQGTGFIDPECSYNLGQFSAAADRGDVDWFGAYHWVDAGASIPAQVLNYLRAVGTHLKHPKFVFDLDIEGGNAAENDAFMAAIQKEIGAHRCIAYGGAYVRYQIGNPPPSKVPHIAASAGFVVAKYGECCPIKPAYIQPQDRPIFWQYTDFVQGPADRQNYPRSVGGLGCDYSTWLGTPAQYQTFLSKLGGEPPPPPPPPKEGFLMALDDAQQQQVLNGSNAAYWIARGFIIGQGGDPNVKGANEKAGEDAGKVLARLDAWLAKQGA